MTFVPWKRRPFKKQRIRVLLVEDSADDANLLRHALERVGAPLELEVVQDGVSGLRYLQQSHSFASPFSADVVLLDLKIPGKSGLQLLREIKDDPLLKRIPIVVLAGSLSADIVRLAYAMGASAVFGKSDNFDELQKFMRLLSDFLRMVDYPEK
jgi:two-component system, chemotaxis family, response regulator Rcp1